MFERFTDTARRVVVYAQEEARLLDHDHIGSEHILLGLLRDDTEAAVESLTTAGVTIDIARAKVEDIVGRGREPATGNMPFTGRAKKVLELSLREALQLGHNYIGSEHILLGLLREGEGTGARVLEDLGVDFADMRRSVLSTLRSHQRPSAGVAEPIVDIDARLSAIEERLVRIERLLEDGKGRDSA